MSAILLVEADEVHAELARRAFSSVERMTLTVAQSLEEAWSKINDCTPDLVITSFHLPDGQGTELLQSDPPTACPIVVMTKYGEEELAVAAIEMGALDYLIKSTASLRDLPHTAERALREWREIARRKQATKAQEYSEERYRTLFQDSRDAVYISTCEGEFVEANPAALELLGYTSQELMGMSVLEIYADPSDRERLQQEIETQGSISDYEAKLRTKDGMLIDCLITSTVRRDDQGTILGYQGIIRNITKRKHAEQQLLDYQDRLRSLSAQLTLTEQLERRRVAALLHDEVHQPLILTKIKLEQASDLPPAVTLRKNLEEIRKTLEQTIERTRLIAFELSPPELHEWGLESAIDGLCHRMRAKHGIPFKFQDDKLAKSLGRDVRVVLFHAVRELLANVVEHAKARTANVSIGRKDTEVEITVEDDGIGFEPHRIVGRFGLMGIREQLAHLRGRFRIHSAPGRGTRASLSIPIDRK